MTVPLRLKSCLAEARAAFLALETAIDEYSRENARSSSERQDRIEDQRLEIARLKHQATDDANLIKRRDREIERLEAFVSSLIANRNSAENRGQGRAPSDERSSQVPRARSRTPIPRPRAPNGNQDEDSMATAGVVANVVRSCSDQVKQDEPLAALPWKVGDDLGDDDVDRVMMLVRGSIREEGRSDDHVHARAHDQLSDRSDLRMDDRDFDARKERYMEASGERRPMDQMRHDSDDLRSNWSRSDSRERSIIARGWQQQDMDRERDRDRSRERDRDRDGDKDGRLCIPYVVGHCAQGKLCPNRHPDDDQCRRAHDSLRKKPCKWGAECRRPDCIFSHEDGGGSRSDSAGPQKGGMKDIECRYGATCKRADCHFVHPPTWGPTRRMDRPDRPDRW
mmetsp:Transcript_38096/g.104867  ORF Transcript_38096/g.104867 Transcript_38096/m.104867 type:complete len:395 (-) Transcript_38096:193-1377(-)